MSKEKNVAGRYDFGFHAPGHLMGWLGVEQERRDFDILQAAGQGVEFDDVKDEVAAEIERRKAAGTFGIHVWKMERHVLGDLIPTPRQETGDCVSFGVKCAGEKRQIIEIFDRGEEEIWRPWFAPWIYANSRNQILGGRIRGAGSTGAAGAKAVNQFGVLFSDDPGVPEYSGRLADSWGGRGNVDDPTYGKFNSLAAGNRIKIVRLKTVEEEAAMLEAGAICTVASGRGFKMQPRDHKGFHVFTPSGGWAHQMCDTAVMRDPFFAFYRQNSWGENAHGTPLHHENPGGAWNLAEDREKELQRYGCEVYGFWKFTGEDGPIDQDIL